ncbi:MAG: hypothetical protein M1482_05210, partial [Chloroflexi bacterium]|nr:hypothetical protein [Chloroflexota bacterium]
GDVTPDRYTLPIDRDLPDGDYILTAGLYTAIGQSNLTARGESGADLGTAPVVGVLHVTR